MGLFNFLKRTPAPTFETACGVFTRQRSKSPEKFWTCMQNGIFYAVAGTEQAPFIELVDFIGRLDVELNNIEEPLNHRFRLLLEEAGLDVSFTSWRQRYKTEAIQVYAATPEHTVWDVTFEELNEPYAHFSTTVTNGQLSDFVMDL